MEFKTTHSKIIHWETVAIKMWKMYCDKIKDRGEQPSEKFAFMEGFKAARRHYEQN